VRLKGEADLLKFLDLGRLRLRVNLSGTSDGTITHKVTNRDIDLPSRIRLLGAEPSEIRLTLTRKSNADK
jgi:hypothetical protein